MYLFLNFPNLTHSSFFLRTCSGSEHHKDVQRSSSYGETLNAEDDEVHVYDHFRTFEQFQDVNENVTAAAKNTNSILRNYGKQRQQATAAHEVHFSPKNHRVFGDSNIFSLPSSPEPPSSDDDDDEELSGSTCAEEDANKARG